MKQIHKKSHPMNEKSFQVQEQKKGIKQFQPFKIIRNQKIAKIKDKQILTQPYSIQNQKKIYEWKKKEQISRIIDQSKFPFSNESTIEDTYYSINQNQTIANKYNNAEQICDLIFENYYSDIPQDKINIEFLPQMESNSNQSEVCNNFNEDIDRFLKLEIE